MSAFVGFIKANIHICPHCKQEVHVLELETHIVRHFVEKFIPHMPKISANK